MSTRLFLAFAAAAYALPGYLYRASQPALAAAPAAANTYLVNSTADAPDSDPANGICTAPNGTCTLRAAIMQADFDNARDTTILPANLYLLTRVGNDDNAVVGDLDISSDMTIQGAGPGATIIDGNGGVTGDRVFQVLASAKDVRLSGLAIRNGEATAANFSRPARRRHLLGRHNQLFNAPFITIARCPPGEEHRPGRWGALRKTWAGPTG